MFVNSLSFGGALSATTLFLSVAASTPAAAYDNDLPRIPGQMKLNRNLECSASFGYWDRPTSDTCIPNKDLGFKSIEVVKPWPRCMNGSEALFAAHDRSDGTCNPAQVAKYFTRSEVLLKCFDIRAIGSFAFHCEGAPQIEASKPQEQREGGLHRFPTSKCHKTTDRPELYKADTCIPIDEGLGLSFTGDALCANGTKALIAGFKGKNCDPTSKPLKEPFTEWDDRVIGWCVPTEDINSMMFWCDGLEGLDMTKPYTGPPSSGKKGSNMGLILGLSFGLGLPLCLAIGLFVAYNINYHFRERVKVSNSKHNHEIPETDILNRDCLALGKATLLCDSLNDDTILTGTYHEAHESSCKSMLR